MESHYTLTSENASSGFLLKRIHSSEAALLEKRALMLGCHLRSHLGPHVLSSPIRLQVEYAHHHELLGG